MQFGFNRVVKGIGGAALLCGVVFGLAGCGGSNNDQGASFTLTQFHPIDPETGVADLELITNSSIYSLNANQLDGTDVGDGTFVEVENNMSNVFITTDRVLLSYTIPGTTVEPPTTTVPMFVTLGPKTSEDTSQGSNLDGFTVSPNSTGYFTFIPPEISTWLTLNQDSFPAPSFTMIVHIVVSGVTSAGDRLDTNEADFTVLVVR